MVGSPTDIGTIVYIQNKGPLIGALSFGPTLSSWGSVWGTSRSQGKKNVLGLPILSFPVAQTTKHSTFFPESETRQGMAETPRLLL